MPDPALHSILSPDRRVEVRFMLGEWCAQGRKQPGAPLWQVWLDGKPILRRSLLGTGSQSLAGSLVDNVSDEVPDKVGAGFTVVKVTRHRIRRTWQPERGDAAERTEFANELVVRLQEQAAGGRRVDLIFRCANEGAAVRLRVPRQRGVKEVPAGGVGGVLRFPEGTLAWVPEDREGPPEPTLWRKEPVDQLKSACALPLLLNFAHGRLACLVQAGGSARTTHGDGAQSRLVPTGDGLAARGDATPGTARPPYDSPWQVVLLGDSPCGLLQNGGWLLGLEEHARLRDLPVWLLPARVSTPAHCAARALVVGEGVARWDETRWLRGAFDEFFVVARRLGNVWQVAGITGAEARVLTVRLEDVLGNRTDWTNRAYTTYCLQITRDPLPGEASADGLVRETFHGVDCFDKPRLELRPHGGFVLRLEPASPS